jgi:hypothetical protein
VVKLEGGGICGEKMVSKVGRKRKEEGSLFMKGPTKREKESTLASPVWINT